MKRLAAATAAAALIGSCLWALPAPARAGPSGFGAPAPPRVSRPPDPTPAPPPPPRVYAVREDDPIGNMWTDPAGTFSFENRENWREIEAASPPGAPVLEIVGGDNRSECWFLRIPREKTAALSPSDLIAARAKPLDRETWSRLAADQHLLQGQANVLDAQVEREGVWPVQTAWLRGRQGDVFAALHSRPGVDIWVFCASKDQHDHSAALRLIARSVTTPKDAMWEHQIRSQASLTAVP
jgi:hypothetical protein